MSQVSLRVSYCPLRVDYSLISWKCVIYTREYFYNGETCMYRLFEISWSLASRNNILRHQCSFCKMHSCKQYNLHRDLKNTCSATMCALRTYITACGLRRKASVSHVRSDYVLKYVQYYSAFESERTTVQNSHKRVSKKTKIHTSTYSLYRKILIISYGAWFT